MAVAWEQLDAGTPRARVYLRDAGSVLPAFLVPGRQLPDALVDDVIDADARVLLLPSGDGSGERPAASFGLTPAEERLAAKLVDGLSLKEAAAELGIAHATVRNQLRSIFARVGVNRQPELVRVLLQSSQLDRQLAGAEVTRRQIPELVYAPRQRFTLPDERTMTWREYGAPDGRPLLYFHNGLGTTCFGRPEAAAMRELGLRVITFDRPGFGGSDACPGYTTASVAADARELLCMLGIEHAAVLAFGAGGPFALQLALDHPEAVRRIAWCAPRPEPGSGPLGAYARAARFPWLVRTYFSILVRGLNLPVAESMLRRMFPSGPDAASAERHRRKILHATLDGIGSGYGVADDMLALIAACPIDVARLTVPLILWRGEHDSLASAQAVHRYALTSPVAEVRLVEDVGHTDFHEQLPQVLADLAR